MAAVIRPLGKPGDLGWVVMAHGELYRAEYGYDATFEVLVARIVADFAANRAADRDPVREGAWIAELDGRRAGCILCVAADGDTAQLRVLLVDPSARGHGLGGRLVDECLRFARDAGYKRMVLWTTDPLVAARHLYLSRGFTLTGEERQESWGVVQTTQHYELDLTSPLLNTSPAEHLG